MQTRKATVIVVVTSIALALAAPATSEPIRKGKDPVSAFATVAPGAHVRIEDTDGRVREGRYVATMDGNVVLDEPATRIPAASIRRVWIRGRAVNQAIATLRFTRKTVARDIEKVLQSAIANAAQKDGYGGDVERLFVSACYANQGPSQKRVRPAPMGRAFRVVKRTTHLTVADKWGNVVAYTLTIEQTGGSGITVPGRGFILNNELTDFSFTPADPAVHDPNLPGPGKRPRSSISPTIVLDRHNKPVVALGSPGGATIVTTVLQTLTGFLDRGLPLVDAIAAPRASQRNQTTTELEPGLWNSPLRAQLEAIGHQHAGRDLAKAPTERNHGADRERPPIGAEPSATREHQQTLGQRDQARGCERAGRNQIDQPPQQLELAPRDQRCTRAHAVRHIPNRTRSSENAPPPAQAK